MNKLIITAAVIIAFTACNNKAKTDSSTLTTDTLTNVAESAATLPVDSANAPVITFETKAYNFGSVTDGEKVSYEYKFANTGKSPLIIANAIASCGCTVPDYPRTPIAPGGSGVISVIFDSAGKVGVQNKVITLTTNAIPQISELQLLGEVKAKN